MLPLVLGQPGLYSGFKVNLECIERPAQRMGSKGGREPGKEGEKRRRRRGRGGKGGGNEASTLKCPLARRTK